jgi:hypothetical protein
MKKILALVLTLSILLISGSSFAASGDVPTTAAYYSAVERVTSLGIMDYISGSTFKPNDATTREQFAKIIIMTAGLSDSAETMTGSTVFSDVAADGSYNGYINLCVSKGYMSGLTDGKFHPTDAVTYSQAITALIMVLGYSASDLTGTWPKNYIEKAKTLGLSDGMTLTGTSKVPRWAMAQILDRLLDTATKADSTKTLAEASNMTLNTMYTEYSKPEVYYKANVVNSKLGSIDLSGSLSIVKNSVDRSTDPVTSTSGLSIKSSAIEDFNVVYQISDKSGKNKYVLVIDNKLSGTIDGILPNKYTPKQIIVDDITYDLNKYFDTSKLSAANSYSVDDSVTLLLGYDGTVVDIQEALYSDNSSFAFVKNYTSIDSNEAATVGLKKYTVKLLMMNGSVNTFDCNNDPTDLKGKLVIYKKLANDSVTLTPLNYSTPGEVNIRKDDKQILSNEELYINNFAGNVKIINYISNINDVDAEAEILAWSDLPSGELQSGEVMFMNKTGEFEDVNLILLNNVSERNYMLGVVKSVKTVKSGDSTSSVYTMIVEGKEYSYTVSSTSKEISIGAVLKLTMSGNAINSITEIKYPDTQSTMIQAVDADRIRANSRTYSFSDDCLIYLIDSTGSIQTIDESLLSTDKRYNNVSIYTDIDGASGGETELVIVR